MKPATMQRLASLARFASEVNAQSRSSTILVRASGIAFNSLLAIVPLMVLFFSLFAAFQGFAQYRDQVQQWLFEQVVPARSADVLSFLEQFSERTKAVGVFSLLMLVVTSILLFDNVEKNVNAIWKIQKKRSVAQRLMIFTSVLLWGPILLTMSFISSSKIRLFGSSNSPTQIAVLEEIIFGVMPWVLTVVAFSLLMAVIPYTRVKWRSVLLGGIVGGTMWELAKLAFTYVIADFFGENPLYGSLVAFPIFLLWLYVTCAVVLFAAVVTYVAHNYESLILRRTSLRPSCRERIRLAVRMYFAVARGFLNGDQALGAKELEKLFGASSDVGEEILTNLVQTGLLATSELDDGRQRYFPAKSLAMHSLQDVALAAYHEGKPFATDESVDASDSVVVSHLHEAERVAGEILGRQTMLALLTGEALEGATTTVAGPTEHSSRSQ